MKAIIAALIIGLMATQVYAEVPQDYFMKHVVSGDNPALFKDLTSGDSTHRKAALKVYSTIDDVSPQALENIKGMIKDADFTIALDAMITALRAGPPHSIEGTISGLGSSVPGIREMASRAVLGQYEHIDSQDESVVSVLVESLGDGDADVRGNCAMTLLLLGHPAGERHFSELLTSLSLSWQDFRLKYQEYIAQDRTGERQAEDFIPWLQEQLIFEEE